MATFNLATDVQRELPEETFDVKGAERTYVFQHPKLIPALDLMNLRFDDVHGSMQAILGEDYAPFIAEPGMDGFAMERIFDGWLTHFGLKPDGEDEEETRGNSRAPQDYSPRKTARTSGRSKQTSRGTTRGKTR